MSGIIANLIAPLSQEVFFHRFWEQGPCLVKNCDASRFEALLSISEIDQLLASGGLRYPAYRIVRDFKTEVPLEMQSKQAASRRTTACILQKVADSYSAGATILLQSLERRWPPLIALSNAMRDTMKFAIQANAYLTPPNAQGFPIHYDSHDVLLLQISGKKNWRVWEGVVEKPVKTQKFLIPYEDVERICADRIPLIDAELSSGSVLYIPRGFPHEGKSLDADSLHITLGFFPARLADAVVSTIHSSLNELSNERSARRSIFSALVRDDPSELGAIIDALYARSTVLAVKQTVEDAGN